MTKWTAYQVNAGGRTERRFCKEGDVRKRDQLYKQIGTDLFEDRSTPDNFPHHDWERTEFALDLNTKYDRQTYEQLIDWLDYVFWDSSTDFMVRWGMPTHADIEAIKEYCNQRTDFTNQQKDDLIRECDAYVDGA